MNDGTFRGSAQAFKLDTLLKLADVKGVDGKTTLLHFVVQEIIRAEGIRTAKNNDLVEESSDEYYRNLGLEVVASLSSELEDVKRAAVLDSDGLTGTVSKFGNALLKAREFLNTDLKNIKEGKESKEDDDDEDEFAVILSNFVQDAEKGVMWMLEEEKKIMALVKSTADYFHGQAGKDEGLRLFVIVRDFLIILDKVCKEIKANPLIRPQKSSETKDELSFKTAEMKDDSSSKTTEKKDFAEPGTSQTEDVMESRTMQTEDVVEPGTTQTEDGVEPRSAQTEDIVEPSTTQAEDVAELRTTQTEYVVEPRTTQTEDVAEPRKAHTEDVVEPTTTQTEDVSSFWGPESDDLQNKTQEDDDLLHETREPNDSHQDDESQPSTQETDLSQHETRETVYSKTQEDEDSQPETEKKDIEETSERSLGPQQSPFRAPHELLVPAIALRRVDTFSSSSSSEED